MSKKMHHLNIGNESYEVVDDSARSDLEILGARSKPYSLLRHADPDKENDRQYFFKELEGANNTSSLTSTIGTVSGNIVSLTFSIAATATQFAALIYDRYFPAELTAGQVNARCFKIDDPADLSPDVPYEEVQVYFSDLLTLDNGHTGCGFYTTSQLEIGHSYRFIMTYICKGFEDTYDADPDAIVIADGSVVTEKIADNAVTLDKMALGVGLSDNIKQALLNCFEKVAWIDDQGQSYMDALESALYPDATLTSISAVYTQSGIVYDTDDLDDLKADLVVTANYDDGTSAVVTAYTLSGTLAEGTSTITAFYGGQTDTFSVTVTELVPSGYTQYDYISDEYTYGQQNVKNAIVTNVAFSSDYFLETEIQFVYTGAGATNNTQAVMGSRSSGTGTKEFALFCNNADTKCGYWYGGADTTKIFYYTLNEKNTLVVKPVGQSDTYPNYAVISINGVDYSTGSTASGVTWSSWFAFFGYGTSSGTSANATSRYGLKIGRTKFKDTNGNVLYDFIPAYNGTYYGFYEKVNGTFYSGMTPALFTGGNWE